MTSEGHRIAMGAWAETERQCTEEGQEAYVAGRFRGLDNPYRPGTLRHIAWVSGWDAAYKADCQ